MRRPKPVCPSNSFATTPSKQNSSMHIFSRLSLQEGFAQSGDAGNHWAIFWCLFHVQRVTLTPSLNGNGKLEIAKTMKTLSLITIFSSQTFRFLVWTANRRSSFRHGQSRLTTSLACRAYPSRAWLHHLLEARRRSRHYPWFFWLGPHRINYGSTRP